MKSSWLQRNVGIGFCLGVLAVSAAISQETSTLSVVVTAVPKQGEGLTSVPQGSVSVSEGGKRREVSAWVPLRDSRAGLQFVVLLDDSSRGSLSLQLKDIANFIQNLPPGTEVAVGYMRNGIADLVAPFTTDRSKAIGSLRMPLGSAGINGSPYFCLTDLIKRWPENGQNPRREVLMVTDGVDRYSGRSFDSGNPYVRTAITDAQKAGVVVYSIYYGGAGRFDSGIGASDTGQNYLSQVAEGTGGQLYAQGFGNPVSLTPFLSDIQRRLQNQYELSFESFARKGVQALQVKTSFPNTKLVAPKQVWVGARVSAPQ